MAKQQFILINIILIFCVFVIKTQAFEAYEVPIHCYNPNGRKGLCVSIYECQSLLNVLKTQQQHAFPFVRKSECLSNGQGRRPHVCCTSDTEYTTRNDLSAHRIIFPEEDSDDTPDDQSQLNTTTTSKAPRDNFSLFPKPPECGPIAIGNKIYGGEETELGEFPWLANLEYRKSNGDLVSVCAGNIINQKYLLTAAHCVKGEIEVKVGQLVSVRVGDHNTETPVDCNNSGCLDAFQRMGVAKIIVHAGYRSNSDYHNHHDIALIKTDRNIQYSVSVAPICLPDVLQKSSQLKSGTKLYVAGWGHTGTKKYSAEKRKVDLPYVENDVCPIKVAPEQLCAGGEYKKDSCTGDSGGALVRLTSDAYIVEGIVSFGRGCGLERPAVYTRVSSYIGWIHSHVES